MIDRCLTVFKGVGPVTEKRLRAAGIRCWADLAESDDVPVLGPSRRETLRREAAAFSEALARRDVRFFAERMSKREHWRLFGLDGWRTMCLDIETTGLSPAWHDVTMVGLCDDTGFTQLVRGVNLTEGGLAAAIEPCDLLITYFGVSFDVPFLRHHFPSVPFDVPHFDLCFAGRRVGLTGGLKAMERALGLARATDIAEVDGFEAVRLWRRYERGDQAALERLRRYNEADTRNLLILGREVHERLARIYGMIPGGNMRW